MANCWIGAAAALAVGCRTGVLAVSVEPAGPNPLAQRFVLADRIGSRVTCASEDDPTDVLAGASVGLALDVVLAGFRPDATYTCDVAADGLHDSVTVSVALDDRPPRFALGEAVEDGPGGAGVWTVFVTYTGQAEGERLWVVDALGRGRMTLPLARDADDDADHATSPGLFAEPTPSGLLIGGGRTHPPAIVDATGVPVFQAAALTTGVATHDAELQDGQLWVVTWYDAPFEDIVRTEFALERVEVASGETTFTWRSGDAVAAGELEDDGALVDVLDPFHANGLAVDPSGDVWVSVRNLDTLLRIDPDTGAIVRRFGPQGDVVAPAGEAFYGQHDPSVVADGAADRLLLLDNGSGARPSSRVVEYRLPDGPGVAEVTRAWTEDGWFEPAMGGVMTLPDGDWFVTRTHCGNCGGTDPDAVTALLRVDPDTGAVRWRAEIPDPGVTVYRARAIDPCALGISLPTCAAPLPTWSATPPDDGSM